ncbi:MAG: hypothetical protein GQ569_01260 [Methylococcaceae bacterium]|nr:hypothetical protein [Methylococcaceae bacterium]
MSFFTTIKKKTTLTAATNQVAKARKAEGGKADQLYKTAYEGFEFVLSDNLMLADALYNWGFGLLNQAKSKEGDEAIKLYEDAINKYSFCLTVEPYYLGAAVEGGVAYMDTARLKGVAPDDDLYVRAKKCFEQAGNIQKGSGAFNLACIYSISGDNEGCLAALKDAKEFGHLPDDADILSDPDMQKVIKTPWFTEFLENIKAEKEAEAKAEEDRKKAKAEARAIANGKVPEKSEESDDSAKAETEAVKETDASEEEAK